MKQICFKKIYTLNERKEEFNKIHNGFPNRIPAIVEPCNNLPPLGKSKFLLPEDITMGQFIYIIRKRMNLDPHEALFFFINGRIMSSSTLIIEIYERYKDIDGFLYVVYSKENTFGN